MLNLCLRWDESTRGVMTILLGLVVCGWIEDRLRVSWVGLGQFINVDDNILSKKYL